MGRQDIDEYRFGSGQDPTDEMLEQIMREMAQEARERWQRAERVHMEQMLKDMAAGEQKWKARIEELRHGG